MLLWRPRLPWWLFRRLILRLLLSFSEAFLVSFQSSMPLLLLPTSSPFMLPGPKPAESDNTVRLMVGVRVWLVEDRF